MQEMTFKGHRLWKELPDNYVYYTSTEPSGLPDGKVWASFKEAKKEITLKLKKRAADAAK